MAFNTISDRSDDVISPIDYYESCAYVLDAIYHQDTPSMKESNLQEIVEQETNRLRHRFEELNDSQWLKIRQIIAITVLSILTFHIQATAHKMTADIL